MPKMFTVSPEEFRQRFRKMTPAEKAALEGKPEPDRARPVAELVAKTKDKDGKEQEVRIDLAERLKYWGDFYRRNNVDWITPLPDKVALTPEQRQKMQELMAEGFTHMIIIPEKLVDEPQIAMDAKGEVTGVKNPSYKRLHEAMSQGYNATQQWDSYEKDGGLEGSQDTTTKLRIILTKDVQNLKDDAQFQATIGKSIDDLKQDELKKYTGFSEAAYLVYQKEYFEQTGKHLDEVGYTWLPESRRPLSGRVPHADWNPAGERLHFGSSDRVRRLVNLGCRLAGSFTI